MALTSYWVDPPDGSAVSTLKYRIDQRISKLFDDRTDVLFDVKRGFNRRVYFDQNGTRKDDYYILDPQDIPELPQDYNIDPIARLIDKWGLDWEATAWEETRPDIPAPSNLNMLMSGLDPQLVYTVTRNHVEYKVNIIKSKI